MGERASAPTPQGRSRSPGWDCGDSEGLKAQGPGGSWRRPWSGEPWLPLGLCSLAGPQPLMTASGR